jgi:hypothetical protein
MSHDPVLGNLTLRYPDTLLELLKDSTVRARIVLRHRMEMAMRVTLENGTTMTMASTSWTTTTALTTIDDMVQLHAALRHTGERYSPRPLRARLISLPPHSMYCRATLSSIVSSDVGTVVQIHGTCVRIGPVRMMETMRAYCCTEGGDA